MTERDGDDEVHAHVYVSGRVQGVAYRANTREAVRDYDIEGWVRNLDDGRVEAVFEGPRPDVEEMVEWCETGSPAARVDDVEVEFSEPKGASGFRVRW
ncbi:acylphosphatase [Salinigranum rubrum]|uniref:acylphosphatase n=1 Tax=Salinigranum rubrum TaxID=755307 RepID=A0A2I8VIG0_9EURY|nr:acylphosphatase [Salinigranum rubrum]AUV81695.1 acylphosphatase [Salinigranum rubrum]